MSICFKTRLTIRPTLRACVFGVITILAITWAADSRAEDLPNCETSIEEHFPGCITASGVSADGTTKQCLCPAGLEFLKTNSTLTIEGRSVSDATGTVKTQTCIIWVSGGQRQKVCW
jgi:hypothetical protein